MHSNNKCEGVTPSLMQKRISSIEGIPFDCDLRLMLITIWCNDLFAKQTRSN